jgi:hypothetical protein
LELRGHKVVRVPKGTREKLVLLVNKVQLVLKDQLDPVEDKGPLVQSVYKGSKGPQAQWVLVESKESRVTAVIRVIAGPLGPLVLVAHVDLKAQLVRPVHRVRLVQKELKDRLAHKVRLVLADFQVNAVRKVSKELKVIRVSKALMESVLATIFLNMERINVSLS